MPPGGSETLPLRSRLHFGRGINSSRNFYHRAAIGCTWGGTRRDGKFHGPERMRAEKLVIGGGVLHAY